MRVMSWRCVLSVTGLGVVAMLLPLGLTAQQAGRDRVMPEVTIIDAGGAGPDFDTRTVRRGFNLFAGSDAAFSGMRATGNYGTAITNYGDCTTVLRNCQGNAVYVPARALWYSPFFEVEWAVAAPPHEYAKIRAVAPSVANASGAGWTSGYNREVLGQPRRFGPADGTLGRMFSGVTNTADGSCRDHTGRANGLYNNTGLQLLAMSDCPETWGSEGWRGARPIDQAGWKRLFDRDGDAFRWDYWRVPAEDQRLDLPFLGTRHQTYGETSDYSADVLPNYGAVVPGGVGLPVYEGYPLGLLIHFDAFNFADPRVNDAYFVQVTIVNRSQDVWGTGIDYDSLYLGFSEGALFGNDNASRYALPDRGMVLHHNSNVQGAGGPCDDAYRRPDGNACTGSSSAFRGYGTGAVAEIFLKSPLGDLRNKLFTRTPAGAPCTVGQDPFCHPGHPLAGDTITFNHQNFGDYGGADAFTWGSGARPAFGFMAGDEVNTLAGRDPNAQTNRTLWTTFRSEDWLTNRVHYNKYVPPASPPWDYNHDGIPDTLALATCGRYGCAAVDSDTMPGGWVNRRGNIGGLQSFGPFKLKAGDTTSLIYAMVGDGDSTALWGQIDAVIDLYLDFFAAAEPPPPARVLSTAVTPGTDARGTTAPAVRLFFSDAPESWVDPYLAKLAEDVATLPTGPYAMFRAENPWLPDSLRARARHNLARLEIYKSCDGGETWTADADCLGDRAVDVDQSALGLGWQAYAVYDADPGTGAVPNAFTDEQVLAGRTYLYTIVGRSRGATFTLDSAGIPITYTFVPSLWNPLSRATADPNVAAVYVAASKPAGYRGAAVAVTAQTTATVPFAVSLSDNVASASYRAVFGTEILVARDSNTVTRKALRSVVTVQRRALVDVAGVGVDSVIWWETFTDDSPAAFLVTGSVVADLGTVVVGDTARTTTVYGRLAQNAGLGLVLAEAGGRPVFGSMTLAAGQATPAALLGRADYPGFMVEADNTLRGAFESGAEAQRRGPQSITELKLLAADTIVPRDIVDANMVQWREASSVRTPDGGGRYAVAWADDPFGTTRGFVLDLANAGATEAEVREALVARPVAATGLTDQATANLLGVTQLELVAVKLPFTIRNTTFDRPVEIAMVKRLLDRVVLGTGQDTISVAVPADVWVPSDRLYLLENIVEDSTVDGRLVMGSPTEPLRRTRRAVTFSRAVLGCDQVRESCNPVPLATPGATGYDPMRAGDQTRFGYYVGFTPTTEYGFTVTGAVTGAEITAVTDSALRQIRVVPNPFVVFSFYQTSLDALRVVFTHVPPTGTLRIYTVAGQLVQQITWGPGDLLGDGDLFWNLESMDGAVVNAGLYLWVLTAPSDPTNPHSTPLHARGKLVIIR